MLHPLLTDLQIPQQSEKRIVMSLSTGAKDKAEDL